MSDKPQPIYIIRWSMKSGVIIRASALPMPADPTTMVVTAGRLRGQQIHHWDWAPTEDEARDKIKREVARRILENAAEIERLGKLDFNLEAAIIDGETAEISVVMA